MIDRIFSIAHLADQAVLVLLLTLTALAVYLIIDKFIYLQKLKKQSLKLKSEMLAALHSQDYFVVKTLALRNVHFVEKSLSLALQHYEKFGSSALPELFRSLQLEERPKLEKSLGFLATVGSNAPYIGLFGTVLGIMKSFYELGQNQGAGQNSVMAGISAALVATAAGLLVAIPAVLAYNYLQKQVKVIMSTFEVGQELLNLYIKTKEVSDGSKHP